MFVPCLFVALRPIRGGVFFSLKQRLHQLKVKYRRVCPMHGTQRVLYCANAYHETGLPVFQDPVTFISEARSLAKEGTVTHGSVNPSTKDWRGHVRSHKKHPGTS